MKNYIEQSDLEANIRYEACFTAAQGAKEADGDPGDEALAFLTIYVLVLVNGFVVTGESACVDPKNFDSEIGKEIAREDALSKMWPLMGYELKSKIAAK
jgi:hypothetical protein